MCVCVCVCVFVIVLLGFITKGMIIFVVPVFKGLYRYYFIVTREGEHCMAFSDRRVAVFCVLDNITTLFSVCSL